MKKLVLLLTLWFCLSTGFSAAAAPTEKPNAYSETASANTFVLPACLKEIGEAAFENSAAESVMIPESVCVIQDKAFMGSRVLRTVYIPESVVYIGDQAFDESPLLTICSAEGSYAAAWAQLHNIPFTQVTSASSWFFKIGKLLQQASLFISVINWACPTALLRYGRKAEMWVKSMRPQDRPELYPIDYRFP